MPPTSDVAASDDATEPDDRLPEPAKRLLASAGPVFAQRGFDRATVRDIARVADVNVAAVSYYFGDKMGLYQAVIAAIRENREREFPAPVVGEAPPEKTLEKLVRTILSRMLAADASGWESMLMMREMQQPTAALEGMIREYFRPIYDALCETIASLLPMGDEPSATWRAEALVPQMALGVVGQCLYYRIGRQVVAHLIPADVRQQHYDLDSLCHQITACTLAACGSRDVMEQHRLLRTSSLFTQDPSHDVPR